jgi:hypothetical protein
MKKLILMALGLVAGATFVHAQGYMAINGSAADVTISSNSYSATASGGIIGKAPSGAAAFDYAIFVSSTPITDGATDAGWTQVGLVATPTVGLIAGGSGLSAGDILYSGGSQFQSSIAPGTYYVEIAGWSSGLGSSWATVSGELADSFQGESGFYFGEAYSGSANFTTAVAAPGNNVIGADGIANGGLVLFSTTPVPEPATLALAGLGGLSMLFLRRRKS